MRTESFEQKPKLGTKRLRRGSARDKTALEPTAVDAALADDSLPMIAERSSRRDPASGPSPWGGSTPADLSEAAVLESLAVRLDMLHEQQRQIRQLLDRAGRLRIDAANV